MGKTLRCRKCKQIFQFTVMGQLCPSCMAHEEQVYQNVRAYIKDNPGVSVNEISEVTGVKVSKILGYIKEERLEIVAGSGYLLKCKNCSAEITTGMFCDSCKRSMSVDSPRMVVKNDPRRHLSNHVEQGRATTASTMKDYRKDE